ncbi:MULTISPECIES: aquaporin Z [Crateriforma]|uniref:Aquaporin Z 2 n=1 Tax=Crateriforma conspicua TaxID=2527996 RepID=A0A5C6FYC9_9PLAN|nr:MULTISPECIES: aquaporin Z [Crateriforma]TWU67344.1 Aquaporin Z 2 [Crateriforma conspicua]
MHRKLLAEMIGTFILVFGGCGAAVFAANIPNEESAALATNMGFGYLGVSFAFGLTVLGCAYAFGGVSGCHLNPAVTVGLTAAGRFKPAELPGYVIAQVVGAIAASGLLYFLLQQGPDGYVITEGRLAANGYGEFSPSGYSMLAALVAEIVCTFIFLIVILGATSKHASPAAAGIAIGLTLTLIHLVDIPLTNCSVNPARSTGPAVFVGGSAIGQLWLFWVAPLAGAALAGVVSRIVNADDADAA